MTEGANPYRYLFPELPEPELTPSRTALLIVDMQYFDASRDHGWGRRLQELGVAGEFEWFFKRLEQVVIPNIRSLQDMCRASEVEVLFVRIEMSKRDLSNAGRAYRLLGFDCPRGSKEAEILEEVAPASDEIVIAKTSTSAFNSSVLDQVLRNLGVDVLLVAGVNTDGCVELTSRDAADRGYWVVVIEDACACLSGEANHQLALMRLNVGTMTVKGTAGVLAAIKPG